MESKSFWTSKTMWFNFLSGVLLVLDANQGIAKHFLGEQAGTVIAALVIAGNAFLRTLTVQAIATITK
ncbi:MAG: hypothetical protein HQM08_17330 [Candidatus Riflebacteria bacterium]|nr:hypothetical protein [Candidatus Riflebacteria bacterium]